jgi:hypothetical protein
MRQTNGGSLKSASPGDQITKHASAIGFCESLLPSQNWARRVIGAGPSVWGVRSAALGACNDRGGVD